ncbi:hypothetical protein [Ruminococcus albus]|uniref:Uncharacterized protein n=1 Tax=Ruminococcus albus TaxID=1264 RepID=A0A1H7NAE4_RUMAL|nr:hypothetical protein [Ruminococcus albus]SEL19938.1 hypothetical protein SAMN05216469_11448 [Ruminococcus albus]
MTDNRQTSENMRPLLEEAAKKLGIAPETLAGQISSGDLGNVLKKLPASQQEKFTKTLADKNACQKLMESPQAQALMRKISGK